LTDGTDLSITSMWTYLMTKLEVVQVMEAADDFVLCNSEDALIGRMVRLGVALKTADDNNAPAIGLELACLVAFAQDYYMKDE